MFYSAIGILAAAVLLIENQDILLNRNGAFERPAWKVYRRFLLSVLLYYLTDILWGILGRLNLIWPMFIDRSVNFIAMAVGVLFWTMYIVTYLDEKNLFARLLLSLGRIFAAAVSAGVVVNIFVPVLFTVDGDGTYHALGLRYVCLVVHILILLLVSVYAFSSILRSHAGKKQKNHTPALFGLLMAAFLLVQLWFPDLPGYAIAYMFGTCLLRAFVIGEEKEELRRKMEEASKIAAANQSVASLPDHMPEMSVSKESARTEAAAQEGLNASVTYENLIEMLSKDYFDLYYVNVENEEYIEFGSKTEDGHRTIENRGTSFFESLKEDALKYVYAEDQKELLKLLDKETLLAEISRRGMFRYYYRLLIGGAPTYVSMKAMRVIGEENHIIIGVTNVDAQIRDRISAEQAKEERKAYLRLSAFSRNLLVLYVVDPESEEYTEFSASEEFVELGIAKKGSHFFEASFRNSLKAVYTEDRDWFLSSFTKENLLESIKADGIFVLDYRMVIQGDPTYVRLKASEVEEEGKTLMVIGVEDVDVYVRREKEQAYDLSVAREMATKDALTGVKNRHAFLQAEKHLNEQIKNGIASPFAVVVFDINGLKDINDSMGHQMGDQYIRKACSTVCDIFKRSRVFRIGGDEFAVICQGKDYKNIESLLAEMDEANSYNKSVGDVQIAYGKAEFEDDSSVQEVFERADRRMYAHKDTLKS